MNAVEQALLKAKENGMDIQTVAKMVGVSRVTVSTWKKNGFVSENFVLKFSDVTGVPPWTINKLAKELGKTFAAA